MARRKTTQTTEDPTADTMSAAGTDAANAEAPAPAPPPTRRGRSPRTDTPSTTVEAAAAVNEPGATTDVEAPQQQEQQTRPKQRRRRRRTIDTAAEASLLIVAVLRQRGAAGASHNELQQVVAWGRSVRAESQELQRGGQKTPTGSGRGRRRPSDETIARAQRSELNTLLLERVLLGTLGIDVQQGQLVFQRRELEGRTTNG